MTSDDHNFNDFLEKKFRWGNYTDLLQLLPGLAPRFWKWGDKSCERSEQNIFLTPHFWPLGGQNIA